MFSLRLIAVVLHVALATSTCLAQVKWAAKKIDLDLDSSQASGIAVFEFVNAGEAPVKIVEISAGCGCTVPTLEKNEFAPGESGSFTARFTIGERRGAYAVPLHVRYEGGATDDLALVAQIRELVTYFPTNLVWAPGEARAPKQVELHWDEGVMVEVTGIRSTNAAFPAELVAGHDGKGALVRVSPASNDAAGVSVIVIKTAQGPDRRTRTYTVVARAQ